MHHGTLILSVSNGPLIVVRAYVTQFNVTFCIHVPHCEESLSRHIPKQNDVVLPSNVAVLVLKTKFDFTNFLDVWKFLCIGKKRIFISAYNFERHCFVVFEVC